MQKLLLDDVNIPKRYISSNIGDMKIYNDEYAITINNLKVVYKELSENYYKKNREPRFILLYGGFGSGKTMISAMMARAATEGILSEKFKVAKNSGRLPYFVRAIDMINCRFDRKIYDESQEKIELIRKTLYNSEFLVIDDIGRLNGFKGETNFVQTIIDHRYDNMLATFVNTNVIYSGKSFEKSRMADMFYNFEQYKLNGLSRKDRALKNEPTDN